MFIRKVKVEESWYFRVLVLLSASALIFADIPLWFVIFDVGVLVISSFMVGFFAAYCDMYKGHEDGS